MDTIEILRIIQRTQHKSLPNPKIPTQKKKIVRNPKPDATEASTKAATKDEKAVAKTTGEAESSTTTEPPPMLIALVTTVVRQNRKLTYLWPYRYWVENIMNLVDTNKWSSTSGTTLPTSTAKKKSTVAAVDNYYDCDEYNSVLEGPYVCDSNFILISRHFNCYFLFVISIILL